jgi:hypothetical protein
MIFQCIERLSVSPDHANETSDLIRAFIYIYAERKQNRDLRDTSHEHCMTLCSSIIFIAALYY